MGNGASAGVPEPAAATGVVSPMGGVLIRFTVEEGAEVSQGEQIALLEAMKTEVPVFADANGTVAHFEVAAGERVQAGDTLLKFA